MILKNEERTKLDPFYLTPNDHKGTFITVEGIDGSGKTTVVEGLSEHYEKKGHSVTVIREPGGTPVGEEIRRIFKNPDYELSETQRLLIIQFSRLQLLPVIEKALNAGHIVIADRFFHSTFAMQYWAGDCDKDLFDHLTRDVAERVKPDISIYLNLSLETRNGRPLVKHSEPDSYDQRDDTYFEKVQEGFLVLETLYEEQFQSVVIHKNMPPEDVLKQVCSITDPVVKDRLPKESQGFFKKLVNKFQ